ncbi:hypothetical protein VTO42DRAFT_5191 [Malbranchea cinnamomea]
MRCEDVYFMYMEQVLNLVSAIEEPDIPPEFQQFLRVFSEEEAGILSTIKVIHDINMHEGVTPPYRPFYPMSETELEALWKYLEAAQSKGWIQKFISTARAPILFTKKADRGLHLCVDYRGLNEMTHKNHYPLPQIDELIDHTAFRTRYSHFEYLVIPFGLTNASTIFQAYINEAMKGILDIYYIVYFDDILIYSQNEQEHREHISEVLRRLEARTTFYALKEAFVNPPVLMHFDLGKQIIVHTDASKVAVAGILMQPGDAEPAQSWLSDYHPVAYFSKKLNPAQRNYDTHDQELLAIVEAFCVWHHYLEGSTHPIWVQSDHDNLRYFFTTKTLNSRQARWAEALAAFDFLIEHKPGWCNPADVPSRRPDYYNPTDKAQDGVGMLLTLQQKLKLGDLEPYVPRLFAIQATQDENAVEPPAPRLREIILRLQRKDASMLKVLCKVNSSSQQQLFELDP